MELMPDLTDDEAAAIYAYLRTIPAIRKPRRTSAAANAQAARDRQSATRGQTIFIKYCAGCHGPDGRGTFDLTRAANDLRTEEQLVAWIEEPSRFGPEAKMPAWKGVLGDDEIRAVATHVRALGAR
jgi:mono/diheme cytochrome c family protein